MKKILILIFLMTVKYSLNAQTNKKSFEFIISPQLTIPISEIKKTNKTAFGANISFEKKLNKKLNSVLNLNGFVFPGKNYTLNIGSNTFEVKNGNMKIIQLRLGLKYFLYDEKIWASAIMGIGHTSYFRKPNGFSYATTLGYEISKMFDISIKFDHSRFDETNINGIGVSLGYHFSD